MVSHEDPLYCNTTFSLIRCLSLVPQAVRPVKIRDSLLELYFTYGSCGCWFDLHCRDDVTLTLNRYFFLDLDHKRRMVLKTLQILWFIQYAMVAIMS